MPAAGPSDRPTARQSTEASDQRSLRDRVAGRGTRVEVPIGVCDGLAITLRVRCVGAQNTHVSGAPLDPRVKVAADQRVACSIAAAAANDGVAVAVARAGGWCARPGR